MTNKSLESVNPWQSVIQTIPPGYKQTEVGLIPEDWDTFSIGSLALFTSGSGISVAELHQQSSDTPVPVYGGNGIAGYTTHPLVREPVVVVGRVGQKCGEVYLTQGPAWITDNALYPRVILRSMDICFLALALKASGLNDVKNRNDLPLITQLILHSVRIPLPPTIGEQEAIADVLCDVDALITALDKLIAKKRDIKQAAMQELLTGKRHLPGFSEEWVLMRLGDISAIKTGKKNNDDKVEDGLYPLFVRSQTVERINTYSFDGEAILVPGEGGIGSIFHYINGKFDYHQRVYKISNFSADISGKYIYYCMVQTFNKQATQHSVKATVDSLRLPTFLGFELLAPSLAEQQAIVAIISDIDTEIAALEQKRKKTRLLKQGMMQELLTGKTRLI